MQTGNRYADRINAGQALASLLEPFGALGDVVVVGLPRGGLLVAAEVAEALHAPLDVFPVRKIGSPENAEFAIGAVGGNGVQVLDERLVHELGLDHAQLDELIAQQERELRRQEQYFRRLRPAESLKGRIVILVDDGAATGYTLIAAAAGLRAAEPRKIIVAVPVASAEACTRIHELADTLVCPLRPEPFHAVGLWYVHFEEVGDEEAAARFLATHAAPGHQRR